MGNQIESSDHTRRNLLIGAAAVVVASVTVAEPAKADPVYIEETEKGEPYGVASLDSTGQVVDSAGSILDSRPVTDLESVIAVPLRFDGIRPYDFTGLSNADLQTALGTADSSTSGLAAAIAAVPQNGTLIIPAGDYVLGENLSLGGSVTKSGRIIARGARFWNMNPGKTPFSFSAAFETTYPVSTVAPTTPVDAGSSFYSGTVITISGSAFPAWVRGDIVKIFSDDVIPEARPGTHSGASSTWTDSRFGQDAIVFSVDTTARTVTLATTMRDPYSTNIRVARRPVVSWAIEGATFDLPDAAFENLDVWNSNVIAFNGLTRPAVRDCTIKKMTNPGVVMISCYEYEVTGLKVLFGTNDPSGLWGDAHVPSKSNTNTGYGVIDIGSSKGLVSHSRFFMCRHGYTNDSYRIIAGDADPRKYGRTFATKVSENYSEGGSNTAFDSHHSADACEYINNTANNCRAVVGLRGRNHVVRGVAGADLVYGVWLITETGTIGTPLTHGVTVDDVRVERVNKAAVMIDFENPSRELRPIVVNNVSAYDLAGRLIEAHGATVHIGKMVAVYSSTLEPSQTHATIESFNSEILFDVITADYRQNVTGSTHVIEETTGNSYITGRAFNLLNTAEQATRTVAAISANTGMTIKIDDFHGLYALSVAADSALAADSTFDYRYDSTTSNSRLVSTNNQTTATAAAGYDEFAGRIAPLFRSAAPKLELDVLVTIVAYTMPNTGVAGQIALPAGKFRGQELWIRNLPASTFNLTVQHSSSTSGGGSAVHNTAAVGLAIAPGKLAKFAWSTLYGGMWTQIAAADVV